MVKHIVAWKYSKSAPKEEMLANAERIKAELEALLGKIDGLVSIKVNISPLKTSGFDIVLDSEFETEEALSDYQVHPEHKKAAAFVKSVTEDRVCIDYLF